MICKTNDGLDLYYELKGNLKAKKTLVFLNGLTQSTLAWSLILPYVQNEYKILLMDFIFQGQSSKEGEWRDFNQHAADVKGVIEKEEIKEPVLVGLSYGSFVAQHFAVNYPNLLTKLVLISTVAHKNPYFEAIEHSWESALKIGGYNLLLDIMLPSVLSEDYFLNPLVPIDLMKESRRDLNPNPTALLKLMRATKERTDYRKELQKITVPTLIIQGEKDILLPVHAANEVHLNIKNSKFIVIPNAGHTLNLEHVGQVCKHLISFLSE